MKKIIKNLIIGSSVVAALSTPVALATSCGDKNQWENIEHLYKIWDAYVERNQQAFYNAIDAESPSHDWWTVGSDGHVNWDATTKADAVFLWAYGPGYHVWNDHLHKDKGTSVLDLGGQEESTMYAPNPSDPYDNKGGSILRTGFVQYEDYRLLDNALNITTAGETVMAYHGFENNEYSLLEFVQDKIGKSLEDATLDDFTNLSVFNDQKYVNYGYLALATNESNAMNYVQTAVDKEHKYKVIPFLEVEVPAAIHCAYISYSKKKYYNNVFLSWPREFQLLCERGLTIKVKCAAITTTYDGSRDLLKLHCVLEPKA